MCLSPQATGLSLSDHPTRRTEKIEGMSVDAKPPKHVLIVDDEPAIRELIADAIRRSRPDCRVVLAENGRDAIRACRNALPDLVITDLTMPETNGFDLCKMLREMDGDIPIIAMTGYPSPENVARALGSGARICLRKPFAMDKLLEAAGLSACPTARISGS